MNLYQPLNQINSIQSKTEKNTFWTYTKNLNYSGQEKNSKIATCKIFVLPKIKLSIKLNPLENKTPSKEHQ